MNLRARVVAILYIQVCSDRILALAQSCTVVLSIASARLEIIEGLRSNP